MTRCVCVFVFAVGSAVTARAQTQVPGPTFDVVSVKPNTIQPGAGVAGPMMVMRPDGGLTMTRVPLLLILSLAYQPMPTADMVGLPDWASRDYFDVSATASRVNASVEERQAMVRAMLADRFRMLSHRERREVPSFDLLVARSDGKLGSGLVKSDTDCDAWFAARRKEAEEALRTGAPPPPPQQFDPNSPPPCMLGMVANGIRGEMGITSLASLLRGAVGRVVVNKTGLTGTYRVNMTFDYAAALRGSGVPPASDDIPSVFTALREQLGLRLEPSRTERDVLVIDRLERPTEN